MRASKIISYLKPFLPLLFILLQLASIALAIAFPIFILLPFLVSIISATISFSQIKRSNAKTAAAFLIILVALSVLTWGTASVIMQYGLLGFMQLLIHGPILLSAIGGLLTSCFFTLYHFINLYSLTPTERNVRKSVYLIRSFLPAVVMGCLALLFGLLVLNIMPLALVTVLVPIPLFAVGCWLAGNFLGLIGANQVWVADKIGRIFAIFSAAPGKAWRLVCGDEALFFPIPSSPQQQIAKGTPLIPLSPNQSNGTMFAIGDVYRVTSDNAGDPQATETVFEIDNNRNILLKTPETSLLIIHANEPNPIYKTITEAYDRGYFTSVDEENLSNSSFLSTVIMNKRTITYKKEAPETAVVHVVSASLPILSRLFLFFSAVPSREIDVLHGGVCYMPNPGSLCSNYIVDDNRLPAIQVTLSAPDL